MYRKGIKICPHGRSSQGGLLNLFRVIPTELLNDMMTRRYSDHLLTLKLSQRQPNIHEYHGNAQMRVSQPDHAVLT